MIRSVLVFGMLSFALMASSASSQFREFKSKDGKSLKAKVTKFDSRRNLVTLKLENGRTVSVKPDVFSDVDQDYLREWPMINAFMSNEKLRINIDEPVMHNEWNTSSHMPLWAKEQYTEKTKILNRKFKKYKYPIRLTNQGPVAYSNVVIKCCAYYMQERLDLVTEENVAELKVIPKKTTIDVLLPKKPIKFDSQAVVLISKEQRSKQSRNLDYIREGGSKYQKAHLIGMIVRFSWTSPGGEEVVRELRYPKELSSDYKNKWIEPTGEEVEVLYNEESDDGIPDYESDDDDDGDDGDDDGDGDS